MSILYTQIHFHCKAKRSQPTHNFQNRQRKWMKKMLKHKSLININTYFRIEFTCGCGFIIFLSSPLPSHEKKISEKNWKQCKYVNFVWFQLHFFKRNKNKWWYVRDKVQVGAMLKISMSSKSSKALVFCYRSFNYCLSKTKYHFNETIRLSHRKIFYLKKTRNGNNEQRNNSIVSYK